MSTFTAKGTVSAVIDNTFALESPKTGATLLIHAPNMPLPQEGDPIRVRGQAYPIGSDWPITVYVARKIAYLDEAAD